MKILIVKLGSLGDVVRTSYVLPGLYRKYNNPKISWLTSPASLDLLRFNPYISELLVSGASLTDKPFDLVVSLDDEKEALSYIDAIKYGALVGASFKDGRPVYSDNAAEWFDMGLISRFGKERADELKKLNTREHNEILADMLGIEINGPIFFNSPLMEKRMSRSFSDSYFNIGINSGAGSRWSSKQMELDETLKLIKELIEMEINEKPTRIYLLGGKEEARRHSFIKEAIASDRLIDAGTDNSLLEFAAIIKCCDYVITSDSLALHLAISQKVGNLSFYAPTSAAEIGTFKTGVKVISLSADYCSYKKEADNSSITTERIMAAFMTHPGHPK